jgi:hypothetical protein
MKLPKYLQYYWSRNDVPLKELVERYNYLMKSDFGYKTNEYKDLQRFFNRQEVRDKVYDMQLKLGE